MLSSDESGEVDPARVVEAFAAGWRAPHPHAWDGLLAEDVELVQPLLRNGRGLALWQAEVGRLQAFLPDVTGHVLSWAGRDGAVFIEIELTGTAGGRPLTLRLVDRLEVDSSGLVIRRDAFFDSRAAAMAVLLRPRSWMSWWRSGVGPLIGRRRFLATRDGARLLGADTRWSVR